LGHVQIRLDDAEMDSATVRTALPPQLVAQLRSRLEEAGVPWSGEVPLNGCIPSMRPPFLASRDQMIDEGPSVTAVVCSRDRPDGLRRCLSSLQIQSYPRLAILVVDNGSSSDATLQVANTSRGPFPVSYVFEPKRGLSNARNRSVQESNSEIVAWIDDDETADRNWICELVRGFVETPESGVVCGVMVPGELETQAQAWFEEYGGHSKGRGFKPAVFSPATASEQSPLFPLPPFGTGGNMAMRRSVLQSMGDFDPALGAGTATMGAEDTRALTEILLAGGTVRYQPTAVTNHFHRRSYLELERQLYGYGVGLSAFYTSLLLEKPSLLVPLLKLLPQALRDFRNPDGPRLGNVGPQFPAGLLRAHRHGLVKGPFAYLQARREVRRMSRSR
jgi:GT2 family glycosyltransferase